MSENIHIGLNVFIQAKICQAADTCHENWYCQNQVPGESFIFLKPAEAAIMEIFLLPWSKNGHSTQLRCFNFQPFRIQKFNHKTQCLLTFEIRLKQTWP